MKKLILMKHKSRTVFTLLIVVLTCLAIFSCKKLDFTKTEINYPNDEWLHYDNGTNFTGINANSGGDFDIAVRFHSDQITSYDGFLISQVKFFPKVGYPATYSVTIWEGFDYPTLIHVQEASVISETWNTVYLDQSFYVDATQDLWVGVWVQSYPAGTYPAGCDEGPAVSGKGDLYSIDDGATWNSLYINDALNYNWNIQVFLTSPYGQKVMLANTDESPAKENKEALRMAQVDQVNDGMVLHKMNQAHENN
jgi:hypothetical protein